MNQYRRATGLCIAGFLLISGVVLGQQGGISVPASGSPPFAAAPGAPGAPVMVQPLPMGHSLPQSNSRAGGDQQVLPRPPGSPPNVPHRAYDDAMSQHPQFGAMPQTVRSQFPEASALPHHGLAPPVFPQPGLLAGRDAMHPADDLRLSFNFRDAPWTAVIRGFARDADLSLQFASEPAGTFTYFDDRRYSVSEFIDVLNDHLMTTGHVLVRDDGRVTVVGTDAPIPDQLVPFVRLDQLETLGRNQLASVAIQLRHMEANAAIEEVQQLQSPLGQVRALTNSGRLIVTDTGIYLRRIRDLLNGSGIAAGDGQQFVYALRHAHAEDVAKAITDFLNASSTGSEAEVEGGYASSSGEQRIVAEKGTNSLLIRGNPEQMAGIQQLIADLDRAPREVLVQALLVEVELGNTNELGVELGFQDSVLFDRSVVDNLVTLTQTTTSPNGTQTTNQNIISQTAAPGFNFPNQPLGNNVAANPTYLAGQALSGFGVGRVNGDLGFGGLVLSAGSESVNLLLRALDAQFNIDVLSRPQVRTVENSEAFIQIGQQVPVVDGVSITSIGSANPVIRQDQAGIILKVTPRISPDGRVQIQVNAEKSSFNLAPGTGVPIFTDATNGNVIEAPIKDITTADTTVSVQSGQTIVLGGMITNDSIVVTRKVPWLGDVPLLGRLFRYDLDQHRRKELLVFLTPVVLTDAAHADMLKAQESAHVHLPPVAFSFGDDLSGIYATGAPVAHSQIMAEDTPNASKRTLTVPQHRDAFGVPASSQNLTQDLQTGNIQNVGHSRMLTSSGQEPSYRVIHSSMTVTNDSGAQPNAVRFPAAQGNANSRQTLRVTPEASTPAPKIPWWQQLRRSR